MSSTVIQAQPASPEMTRQRRWRLDARLHKTVLLIHIVAGGTWFGLDVAMAVLVFTAIGTDSAAVRAHTLQSLQLVTVWPMFSVAMLSLITGMLLGLGSRYGASPLLVGGDQAGPQPGTRHHHRHLVARRGHRSS